MLNNNYKEEDNPLGTMQIGGVVGVGMDIWQFTLDADYDFSANKPNPDLSATQCGNKICFAFH